MTNRRASLEDCIAQVSVGHQKTASANASAVEPSLLDKLAAELTAVGAAPVAEGQTTNASAPVVGANPAVVAATDAVALSQVAAAGGDIAAVMAGEQPGAAKPANPPVVSAGDGAAKPIDMINKTPEAAAAAVAGQGGPGAEGGVEKEAELIGRKIAQAFASETEKIAKDQEYAEALDFCKQAGVLEGYDIKDAGIVKTAGAEVSALEKIANKQTLSKDDIIRAAYEIVEFQKQAAAADAEGRQEARSLVSMITKVAEEVTPEAPAAAPVVETPAAPAVEAAAEQEKIASFLKDPKTVESIRHLKAIGLLS